MTRKEKVIISCIIIFLGTVFNMFFSVSLHKLLSREVTVLTFLSFRECIQSIFSERQVLLLFLSFEGFILLCCIMFIIQNSRPYQSQLIKVTEDIYTPAHVGQNQHGSARWLREKEKDNIFSTLFLDSNNKLIKTLIDSGYDDLEFYNCRKGVVKTNQLELIDKKPIVEDNYQILENGGIVLGMTKEKGREKIYFVETDSHTLTIGATRSGKTRCIVIQSICTLGLAGESIVISDPKAELFHYTSEFLKKLGYEVICIDFKNPTKSARYNLLQPVIDAVNKNDMEKAEMYAWDITNILVGDDSSNEKIWENGEKSTIAGAILCVVVDNKDNPEYQNLTNVYWFIAEMSKARNGKTPMSEYIKEMDKNHPAKALLSIAEVAPNRTKGSFDTSALTTLRLFTSKSMYDIIHKSDYNIANIGEKKQALFIILPDEKTTYYPIASLIVSQLYEVLVKKADERGGRLKKRVNFVLDEFGNFVKLSDFSNKLTVAGGRGIRFNFFLQSFEQLTEKYSKELSSIVKSNCQTWVYLQADDDETLESICKKLGKYTTSAYQLSSQHGKHVSPSSSHSISLVGRDLLTIDEIRRIKRPYQIVVGRSHPALMKAPDLSEWYFNKMCGLLDEEHNRKVREERENKRPILSSVIEEIPLWGIWNVILEEMERKEQERQRKIAENFSIFSED